MRTYQGLLIICHIILVNTLDRDAHRIKHVKVGQPALKDICVLAGHRAYTLTFQRAPPTVWISKGHTGTTGFFLHTLFNWYLE